MVDGLVSATHEDLQAAISITHDRRSAAELLLAAKRNPAGPGLATAILLVLVPQSTVVGQSEDVQTVILVGTDGSTALIRGDAVNTLECFSRCGHSNLLTGGKAQQSQQGKTLHDCQCVCGRDAH